MNLIKYKFYAGKIKIYQHMTVWLALKVLRRPTHYAAEVLRTCNSQEIKRT